MARPREAPESATANLRVRLTPTMLTFIDSQRGSRSRSRYIRDLVRKERQGEPTTVRSSPSPRTPDPAPRQPAPRDHKWKADGGRTICSVCYGNKNYVSFDPCPGR